MQDRFKFKVWDSVEKEYIEELDILRFTPYGKLVFNNAPNKTEAEANYKRFIVEQCTGLKDKNGNLIYEGDIIEHYGISKNTLLRVIWKEGYFYCEHLDGKPFNYLYSVKPIIIIGNVHQD